MKKQFVYEQINKDGFYNIKRNSSYQVSIGLGLGIDDGKVQWNDYYYDYGEFYKLIF